MAQRDVTIRISATDNFSSILQRYNTEMKKAEDNTKQVGKQSSDLEKTLKGLFTIALARQIVQFGVEMAQVGAEANQTEERFRALTSTMGGYNETMDGLRRATLGIVDDMHLQQGAMLLVQTANIKTNAELEKFMNLITLTKKPSEDMTTAIQNFGLMLANNSILRLDSFGISASKVRARIIELQETMGVDRSEAFRMAVLEEGAKNIEKFGTAADVAGTSISRLSTGIQNLYQDASQNVATGTEGLAGILEILLGIHPTQQAQTKKRVDETAISLAMDFQQAFDAAMTMTDTNENMVSSFVKRSLELAISDPALLQDMDAFMQRIFRDMGVQGSSTGVFRDILEQTLQIQAANQSVRADAVAVADQQERQAAALAESAANQRMVLSYTDSLNDLNERNTREHIRQLEIEQQLAGIRAQYQGQMAEYGQAAFGEAFSMNGQAYQDTGVPQYMTQDQANAVQEYAGAVAGLVDQMKALDAENENTFTDEEIERAEAFSDKLNTMADNAQNAAEAFENMNLSELFGQASGGRLGEEMDKVIEAMERMGAAQWEITNAQRAFDLRTGRETGLSLAFEDQIAPHVAQIAQQQGADAAVAFMTAFDETMAQAKLMGIDTNAPDFVAGITQQFTNPMNVVGFDPTSFLSGFQPAADNASAIQGSMTIMAEDGSLVSESFYNIAEKAPIISENMGLIETSLGGAVTHTDKIKTNLEDMSGQTYVVKIQPELVNIASLFMQLFPMVVQAVQQAGGVMPGTSQQASQSGTLVRSGGTPV